MAFLHTCKPQIANDEYCSMLTHTSLSESEAERLSMMQINEQNRSTLHAKTRNNDKTQIPPHSAQPHQVTTLTLSIKANLHAHSVIKFTLGELENNDVHKQGIQCHTGPQASKAQRGTKESPEEQTEMQTTWP
jgi:hypothetical protein